MDASKTLGVCQPAAAILLVSIAAVLYHMLMGNIWSIIWWIITGVLGTGVFQALCYGGLEPVAWVLMLIPVLLICFFLAVALFASSMRIDNVQEVPCDRCGRPTRSCGCGRGPPLPPPPGPRCQSIEGYADVAQPPCNSCGRITCPYCQRQRRGNQCPYGRCECPYGGGKGLDCPYCPGAASIEGFSASSDCLCMGGSCNGACQKGQSLTCGGSGEPNCDYQNSVISTTQTAADADYNVTKSTF